MPTYVARISYGKDSLKMLDVIVSRGLPLDRITTSDVWATDTISACLPPVEEFKVKMDEVIWKKYRIEVEHLCARNPDGSKKTYEQMFYQIPKRRKEGRKEGRGYGFPIIGSPWCQALKRRVDDKNTRNNSVFPGNSKSALVSETERFKVFYLETETTVANKDIVEYLGIAADEPKRFGQLSDKKRAPLVEFGIDEDLCGLYCQYAGMLSPTYETSCRDGCWFCHNQGVDQLRLLRKNYPDRWALLLKWDKDSVTTFHPDGHTVHDFDYRFQMEDEGHLLPDQPFKWTMLDSLQMRF